MLTAQNNKCNDDNILTKFCRWWTKDSRTKEKRGEFLKTIDVLISKLYKQREIIGKSDLIAGLVSRYANDLTEFFYGNQVQYATENLEESTKKRYNTIKTWGIVLFVLHVILLVLRWFFKALKAESAEFFARFSEDESLPVADTSHWALIQWGYAIGIFVVIAGFIYMNYTNEIKNSRRL